MSTPVAQQPTVGPMVHVFLYGHLVLSVKSASEVVDFIDLTHFDVDIHVDALDTSVYFSGIGSLDRRAHRKYLRSLPPDADKNPFSVAGAR